MGGLGGDERDGMGNVKDGPRKVDLRRLTGTDLAFLHFKAALALLLFVPVYHSESLQNQTAALYLWIWLATTVAGMIVSVAGLILGAQLSPLRRKGIRLELTGLSLLMAGPCAFLAVQLGIWATTGRGSGLAVMFPYVIMAALLARMVMVATSSRGVVYRIRGIDKDEC